MLFTTTNALEGWTIEQYLGMVEAHAAVGTGMITEIFASLSSAFGAFSESYGEKIELLDSRVMREIQRKAARLAANAVVGLRVDYDEVSAGNKSMVMVTARGTAVRATPTRAHADTEQSTAVSDADLEFWTQRLQVIEMAQNGQFSAHNDDHWSRATEYQVHEIGEFLLKQGLRADLAGGLAKLERYFSALPVTEAQKVLYGAIRGGHRNPLAAPALSFLSVIRGFDLATTIELIGDADWNARWAGLQTLRARQRTYDTSDVHRYEELLGVISGAQFTPALTRSKERKLFGAKEVWECQSCGAEAEGATCAKCSADVRGFRHNDLRPEDAQRITSERLAALKAAFAAIK